MSYVPVDFSQVEGIAALPIDKALVAYFKAVFATAGIDAVVFGPWVPVGRGIRVRVHFVDVLDEADEWGEGAATLSIVLSGTNTGELDPLRERINADLGTKSWAPLGVLGVQRDGLDATTLTDVNDHEVEMRWTVGRSDPERAFT